MDSPRPADIAVRSACPGCDCARSSALVRHPFTASPIRGYLTTHYEGRADLDRLAGHHFEVHKCSACALLFQRTVPAGALLGDLYDHWIPPSEKEQLRAGYSLTSYRYLASQVDYLIQYFAMRPCDISVFDFGAGWSEWSSMARAYGCSVAGAELSQERTDHARAIGIEMIDWDDIPHRRFHFINTEQVFEHLIQPRETLQHLARALRPGGIIKISVPNARGIEKILRRFSEIHEWPEDRLMPVAPLEHVNCFEPSTLERLARRAGLQLFRPRMLQLYNAASGWLEPKEGMRTLLRPFYRHVFPKSTFAYFRKPA